MHLGRTATKLLINRLMEEFEKQNRIKEGTESLYISTPFIMNGLSSQLKTDQSTIVAMLRPERERRSLNREPRRYFNCQEAKKGRGDALKFSVRNEKTKFKITQPSGMPLTPSTKERVRSSTLKSMRSVFHSSSHQLQQIKAESLLGLHMKHILK